MTQADLTKPITTEERISTTQEKAEQRLQALETLYSGPSWPANPRANMVAINTTLGWVGQRNSANTAWVVLWRLDSSPDHVHMAADDGVVTADYDVDLSDADGANYLRCDAEAVGAFTVTLPNAATSPESRVVIEKVDAGVNTITVEDSTATVLAVLTVPGDKVAMISRTLAGEWFTEYRRAGDVVTIAASGSIGLADRYVLANCAGGSRELTLPPVAAARYDLVIHTVKLINDNGGGSTLTVKPHAGGKIDGLATDAAYTFPAIAAGIMPARTFLHMGGAQWYLVDGGP